MIPAALLIGRIGVARFRGSGISAEVSRALLFAAGSVPACVGVALINRSLYGSPMASGYGSLDTLYSRSNLWANHLTRRPHSQAGRHFGAMACVAHGLATRATDAFVLQTTLVQSSRLSRAMMRGATPARVFLTIGGASSVPISCARQASPAAGVAEICLATGDSAGHALDGPARSAAEQEAVGAATQRCPSTDVLSVSPDWPTRDVHSPWP